jgi:multicomponent K+:H+ antiporter subunit D
MSHAPILPILIPFVSAIILMLIGGRSIKLARAIGLASMIALAVLSAYVLVLAGDGTIRVHRLGNWPAPFGIILVLDALSAVMVALTAALALPVLLHASSGFDEKGRHFHSLFQLQIAGLNGAFLTGDIFNLFVFFEVLLLASYALLVHGGGIERTRAGLAYVILNLAGSALFLFALGLIYGSLGTLTLADIAVVLPSLPVESQALARTALALLLAVFALKAALLPVSLWLPHVYSAAAAPIAALFAIMTKVGIYAILRVSAIAFPSAPHSADLLQPWLVPLGLLTVVLGTIGVLAARRLALMAANLVMISSGILLTGIASLEAAQTAAALYYFVQATLVTAGLFLLFDWLAHQRGDLADIIERGPRIASVLTGSLAFLILAIAASGLPPLSGFLGKLMIMQAVATSSWSWVIWTALLLSGLTVALVLARAASAVLWEPGKGSPEPAIALPADLGLTRGAAVALVVLVAASPLLTAAAAPVSGYMRLAADQLHARTPYLEAVLGANPQIDRERRQ